MSVKRYTIAHLLILTTVLAVFGAALMNDSEWWRAWLATLTVGALLNMVLCGIFARGARRAFAIGYAVSAVFFFFAIYMYEVSIPYLLTQLLIEYIQAHAASPPDEEHLLIIAYLFWMNLCTYSSGLIACRWYRQTEAERQAGANSAVASDSQASTPAPT